MKIGIITFTDGTNYGQRLQNYALQELLKERGNDVYTIEQEHKYSFKHKIKVAAKATLNIKKTIREQKRKKSFARFNDQYITFYQKLLPEEGSKVIADSFDLLLREVTKFGTRTLHLWVPICLCSLLQRKKSNICSELFC